MNEWAMNEYELSWNFIFFIKIETIDDSTNIIDRLSRKKWYVKFLLRVAKFDSNRIFIYFPCESRSADKSLENYRLTNESYSNFYEKRNAIINW